MPIKILMVCLGNICRSPLAEGILANKLPSNQFLVDSAGTGNWHVGAAPDKRSISISKQNGIDIQHQQGRQFELSDFENYDIIYAMDKSNFKDLLALATNEKTRAKVKLILNELYPNENVDVPDPYFGHEDGFAQVYRMLDEVCEVIAKKLLNK